VEQFDKLVGEVKDI